MKPIKMQVINARIKPLNRWDKDSIRPGPVGSVGDVNLQVKLKKSSPDMPERYEKAFSGKNEVWSGSNISDGQWTGYTSGGRGATTITQPLPVRSGFKTPVGWMIENILPVDRTRETKMVPLGQYSWETEKARIYRAKTSGDQFLPLPMGYDKTSLPRGSHFPRMVATSIGEGVALPAADIPITDSQFGENGFIMEEDLTNQIGIPEGGFNCRPQDLDPSYVWAPPTNDPRRQSSPPEDYPWRKVEDGVIVAKYPDIGPNESVGSHTGWFGRWVIVNNVTFNPCAKTNRPTSEPYEGAKRPPPNPPRRVPKPGDSRRVPIATPSPQQPIGTMTASNKRLKV